MLFPSRLEALDFGRVCMKQTKERITAQRSTFPLGPRDLFSLLVSQTPFFFYHVRRLVEFPHLFTPVPSPNFMSGDSNYPFNEDAARFPFFPQFCPPPFSGDTNERRRSTSSFASFGRTMCTSYYTIRISARNRLLISTSGPDIRSDLTETFRSLR